MVFAAGAFAQSMDTAYVPFRVNVDATATAQLAGGEKFEKLVRAGSTDTLHIISESTSPVISGKVPKPVAMHSSRGKISLELSRQLYKGVDIALYSLNGKQIMHARADASETIKSISHPNVKMGVYVLSVMGISGSIFTTRLTHSGGGMNIDVSLANENFSSASLMEKALPGNWTITVSAEGHLDTSYAFVPEAGRGKHSVHHITLRQTHHIQSSSSVEAVPSSSSVGDEPYSSSTAVVPLSSVVVVSSSSLVVVVPSSSSAVAPSSSSSAVAPSSSTEITPSSSSSVVVVVPSSSSAEAVPSSSSAEDELSSSSIEDEPSSSSSVPVSSSSAEPLVCGSVPTFGYATRQITPPALTCGNGEKATGITWLGSPPIDWNNPKGETYSGISVIANCGTAKNLMASCSGTLTVQPMISCSIASTAVYEGVEITPPTLACSDGSVPSGIVFSGSVLNWDNPAVGVYAVSAEADCGFGTTPTDLCGILTVNPAALTCGSVPASGISDVAITPPVLICNNGKTATDVAWSGAPDWSNPAIGTYSGISVTAACGSVTKTADCGGSLKVNPATLTCGSVPVNGFSGFEITQPVLTCSNGKTAAGIAWSANAPDWSSPATGTYSGISATADCGTSSGLTASCGGSLTVQPVISCSMASTGYEGTEINQPVLACNNGSEPSGIVFSGSVPNWDNPVVGNYEVFVAADCGQGTSPAVFCGTLKVNPATLTCGSVPASGISDVAITPPALTCSNGKTATDIAWSANAPDWSSPATGTYSGISVTAACGLATKTANCEGSLTVNPATLTCGPVPANGFSGFAITQPTLTCNNGKTATDIAWSASSPDWNNPATGTYSNINATATCGTSSGLTASCSGTLTVQPVISCNMASTTGFEGAAINQPVLACKNGSVPSGIVFSGSVPNWDNPAAGDYEVFAAADCGLGISPAVSCGTLAVNPATLTCGSVPTSGLSDVAITPPVLTCNNGETATDIAWSSNAPNWSSPVSGTYSGISVTATCGTATKTADCSGSLTVSPATLTCGSVPVNGFSGFAITQPILACNNGKTATDVAWSASAPNWSSLETGAYSDISVTATCGTSSSLMASCSGTLAVQPMISCSMTSTAGFEGAAINQPELACNNGSVPSSIVFSGYVPNWDNPVAGDYEVFAVADCGQGISPAVSCGTLTVNPTKLTCGSVLESGYSSLAIKQPNLTCNNGKKATDIAWSENAPNWSNPVSGTYSNISVTAACGSVTKTANCIGSLMVTDMLTCGSVPTRGFSGISMAMPVLTCNNRKTATNIAWSSNAPDWSSPATGTYSGISVTGYCDGIGALTANCSGSLSVTCSGHDNTLTQYCSNDTMKTYGSVTYQGQTYKTVVIGTQTWMAENLNYNASGSRCYGDNSGGDSQNRCSTYGRLYNWATAMGFESSCNSSSCSSQVQPKHRGICPSGWHIPSYAEWGVLMETVGLGTNLMAASNVDPGNYGFSALWGGLGGSDGSFDNVGSRGDWWSATEYDATTEDDAYYAYGRFMYYGYSGVGRGYYDKSYYLLSVRCVQD
jgi:uncharacterized protein (TIGR02145 family)